MSIQSPRVELQRIYHRRFFTITEYRQQVWNILCQHFLARFIQADDTVLDLGCGYGEFINAMHCKKKYAMDLNPNARRSVNKDVCLFEQDCSAAWALENETLDVVFTSNFLEHLPSKDALNRTLSEAKRCLKSGGEFIAVGPNIRYLHGNYWNFYDHVLPLSDLSLIEALELHDFTIIQTIPKFLPYSMANTQPPLIFLKWYLRFPALWPIFGRQFLIRASS